MSISTPFIPIASLLSARHIGRVFGLGAILLSVAACEEEKPIVEEIRAIKTITIDDAASSQQVKYSGIVRAVDRSALSFEVGGQVATVEVNIGANVKQGQVLATLDKEPYELEVDKAVAQLATAKAKVEKDQSEYERQNRLFEQGAGVEKRVEQAAFALSEARSSVEISQSALDLAERDLRKTVLEAPFDGSIGVRDVEPFVEVQRGQKLFEIDAEGDEEVEVGIPETVVRFLVEDMPVTVAFPTRPGEISEAKVTDIGSLAGEGNAYPVKVRLIDPPKDVRSGMTAEVSFELVDEDLVGGHLIPLHALVPATAANQGHLFVYQADSSTVKKVPVRFRGVKDNRLMVFEGVAPGDIVAVAGVSFLSDGMEVKLMSEAKEKKPETLVVQ